MRKQSKWVLVSAAVLAVIACQREESITDVSSKGIKEVTTEFILSVATNAPQTKMSSDVVQKSGSFRGIDDSKLITYNMTMPAKTDTPFVYKTAAPAAETFKLFELGSLYSQGQVDLDKNEDESSRRVMQLKLPIGTNAVLLYGKAPKSQNRSALSLDETNGATKMSISTTPSETMFSATKIFKDDDVVQSYDATARLMILAINHIMGASVDELSSTESYMGYSSLPALAWIDLGKQYEINHGIHSRAHGTPSELNTLEDALGKAYSVGTYINPNEYRAGSSKAIRQMVSDMYAVISAASVVDVTDARIANAKRLAAQIMFIASVFFKEDFTYESIDDIKAEVLNHPEYFHITEEQWNDTKTGYEGAADLNGYPFEDFGIPEGAAQLAFADGEGESWTFSYLHPNKPLVNPTMESFEPRKYLYPAELLYYVNSPIRTTSSVVTTGSYPNGASPWMKKASWTGGGWALPGQVSSTTTGVAVRYNINYGVALLKTKVDYTADAVNNGMYDNRAALTEEATDRNILVQDADITLRGILVGGVNPRMNWQFTRYYTAADTPSALNDLSLFDGVIYDHALYGTTTVPTTDQYTLVYDNYDSSKADDAIQRDVYVALEFVNNGDDFWGRDNLIRNGSVFYLVGQLSPVAYDATEKPNGTQSTIDWPDDHQIPPLYGVNGEAVPDGKVMGHSKRIPRVFIQDFMTSVVFRLGMNSLKKAYYTVPDLRSSTMSLGLSVDLEWETGFTYDIEI